MPGGKPDKATMCWSFRQSIHFCAIDVLVPSSRLCMIVSADEHLCFRTFCRYNHKPAIVFTAWIDFLMKKFSMVLAVVCLCSGPIIGVLAAGFIYGETCGRLCKFPTAAEVKVKKSSWRSADHQSNPFDSWSLPILIYPQSCSGNLAHCQQSMRRKLKELVFRAFSSLKSLLCQFCVNVFTSALSNFYCILSNTLLHRSK